MVDAQSSLKVPGWSTAHVADWSMIDAERRANEEYANAQRMRRSTHSLYAFGDADTASGAGIAADDHNEQVARLINGLGESGAGRRAILRAIAIRQGIEDEDEIEDILHGRSERKLDAPPGLREALGSIGLGQTLVPINLMMTREKESILTATNETWEDLEFEVALDSGSVVHVCAPADCPGYLLQESPGSRRGQEFLMGDGGTIANLGQKQLNLADNTVGSDVQSIFQIAAVTRPLMSVGKICDEGHSVTFDNVCAVVRSKEGQELCRFHREPSGGLYVAKLRLKSPAGFGRPE